MKIANRDARPYVQRRKDFKGSNIFSLRYSTAQDGEWYVVCSYGRHFPMWIYTHGQWFGNSDKYSVSTSKHQSQTRPVSDGTQIHWLDTDHMVYLADYGYTALVTNRLKGSKVA